MLQDLIITGDPELETALEEYEKGDPKELQGAYLCIAYRLCMVLSVQPPSYVVPLVP